MKETENSTEPATQLLIQPGSGTTALLDGIERARESIHIVIFRFDRREVELALKRAARRGVFVHALVAHTSAGQGGEITLRKLEMRLLADGITVTRTSNELVRYHNKMMIVDETTLYLLGFNFTYLDIDRSRSFGIVTTRPDWVREAERLFHADATRQPYQSECDSFIVSPCNSRQKLLSMIAEAQRQILIYDDKLSDPAAMKLLVAKAKSGLDVRVIGAIGRRAAGVQTVTLNRRLHAQVIIADGEKLFLGSQSLRSLELDSRRETGVITTDPEIIRQIATVFEADWLASDGPTPVVTDADTKVEIAHDEIAAIMEAPMVLPPPTVSLDVVRAVVKEAIKDAIMETVHPEASEVPLKVAVKQAARDALHELVH